MASAYERIGGETALRKVVNDFVDRVFDDMMIGFFFRKASRERIRELEFQLAAQLLGGPFRYTGRPLREAHAPHPIMGGQFARRSKILQETLEHHGVPPDVIDLWLQHTEALRAQITSDPSGECND